MAQMVSPKSPDSHADQLIESEPGPSDGSAVRLWAALLLMLLAGLTPLWWTYATWTWQDGHYQYFPLLIAMVGWLAWSRRAEVQATRPQAALVVFSWSLLTLCTIASLLLFSGFLGILTTIVACFVLVHSLAGRGGVVGLLPVLALLFLAVPLPLGLDQSLIFRMQVLASHLASWLLDGAGVMHVRTGVVLITEHAQYMTEEACSGARSLFSSLAVVAVYSVAARHRWHRVTVNLVQTIGWVLIGNALRIALTVVLADHVSTWFAAGTGHELLSLGVFVFILAMVSSTDNIVSGFCETTLGIEWRRDVDAEPVGKPSANDPVGLGNAVSGLLKRMPKLSRVSFLGLGGGLALVAILGLRISWVQLSSGSAAASMASIPRLPASAEDHLPVTLAGWTRLGFEHVQRDGSSLFASDSYQWRFQNGALAAIVSVDCPWDQWHNLDVCYTAIGWQTIPKFGLESAADMARPNLSRTEIMMVKPGRRRGLVIFNAVDATGGDVLPPPQLVHPGGLAGLIRSRIPQLLKDTSGLDKASTVPALNLLPASTIQVFCERSGDLDEGQIEAIRQLYFAARDTLLRSPRWQVAAAAESPPSP